MIQPVPSSLKNAMTGKGIMRVGKGEGGFHLFLALPLMMKILGKKSQKKIVWIIWINRFSCAPFYKQY